MTQISSGRLRTAKAEDGARLLRLLTALRDRWGEQWKIWLVYCYPGPDLWCARRWDEQGNLINATSPGELERLLSTAS